jgi:hypothetical protein
MPQIKIEQENNYNLFELFPFESREDNFGFDQEMCIRIVGIEFFNSFFEDMQWVIYDSAKATRKTYSVVVMCIWTMCNFKHWNILWLRNTIALIRRSSLETFKKVWRRLVHDEGLKDLDEQVKKPLGGNAEKQYVWPGGEVIAFRAFEKAEELSGIDCEEGFFGNIILEEPMERTTGKIIDFEEQRRSFAMIADSAFRGMPSAFYGRYKYKWKGVEYEFKLTIGVRAMFNDWEPNHWINTDIVNKTFPWGIEIKNGLTYEEWVMKDIRNNNWYEMVNKDLVVEGIPGLHGSLVVRNTKFSNPYRDKSNDEIVISDLMRGDPMSRTATIGAPYEGTDPLRFPYRDSVIISKERGYTNIYEVDRWVCFSYGLDFGKVDKTSLTLVGVYWDDYLEVYQKVILFSIEFNPKIVPRAQRSRIRRIDIADKVKEWVISSLASLGTSIKMTEYPIYFTYDEKGEQTAEELEELLLAHNVFGIHFGISSKKKWPIENRQKVIANELSSGSLLVEWSLAKGLYDELWNIEYKPDEIIRDEAHFNVDSINSLEYAYEVLKDRYCDLNFQSMLYYYRAVEHTPV